MDIFIVILKALAFTMFGLAAVKPFYKLAVDLYYAGFNSSAGAARKYHFEHTVYDTMVAVIVFIIISVNIAEHSIYYYKTKISPMVHGASQEVQDRKAYQANVNAYQANVDQAFLVMQKQISHYAKQVEDLKSELNKANEGKKTVLVYESAKTTYEPIRLLDVKSPGSPCAICPVCDSAIHISRTKCPKCGLRVQISDATSNIVASK